MMYNLDVLCEKLKIGRLYRNLKKKRITDFLKIPKSLYENWEDGTLKPDISQLIRIANFEELDLNFFFHENISPYKADLRKLKNQDTYGNKFCVHFYGNERFFPDFDLLTQDERAIIEKALLYFPLREIIEILADCSYEIIYKIKAMIQGYVDSNEDVQSVLKKGGIAA